MAGQWFAHAAIIADQREGRGCSLADELVHCEVAEGVATLTLDRPEWLNAISPALDDALLALLDRAAAEAACTS